MGRPLFPDPETQNHKLHSTKRRWMLRQMYDRTYTRGLGGTRFRSTMTCFWNNAKNAILGREARKALAWNKIHARALTLVCTGYVVHVEAWEALAGR